MRYTRPRLPRWPLIVVMLCLAAVRARADDGVGERAVNLCAKS